MAVKIGHASSSETGKISGGAAGDQNGREVYTRSWYKHSKGWVTLRCKNPVMAEYIAQGMEKACANNDIGYDQSQNTTLWNDVKPYGFDPSKTTKKVETDCAKLVRVCVQYAAKKVGLDIEIPNFYTATLVSQLMSTGLFEKLTEDKYNTQDAYLERGMIQCTKVKGHTWVILTNGSKVNNQRKEEPTTFDFKFGERVLRKGNKGKDVEQLQELLNKLGFNCGEVDGNFGTKTETAVKAFQTAKDLEVDGIVGKNTYAALNKVTSKFVLVTGGTVNVRSTYNIYGNVIMIAKKNEKYEFLDTKNGWYMIRTKKGKGWISSKYSKIVEG